MRSERGFTLIEVCVAIVVLALGIAGALAAFGSISRTSGLAAEYDQAALLAERHLTEVEATGSTAVVAGSGDFGDDYPGYQWEQEIIPSDTQEGVAELKVTVQWKSGDSQRSVTVSTYVAQEMAG